MSDSKHSTRDKPAGFDSFQAAFEHAALALALVDSQSCYQAANPAYCRLLGRSPEELLGANVEQFVYPTDRHKITARLNELRAGSIQSSSAETRWLHQSGESVWLSESAWIAGDPRRGGVFWQAQPIGGSTSCGATRLDPFADNLLAGMPALVLVLDPQQRILRLNRYAEAMTGCPLGDAYQKDWVMTLVDPSERSAARAIFLSAINDGTTHGVTTRLVGKTARPCEIVWSGQSLADERGHPAGVLLVGQDITQLASQQAQSLEAHRQAAVAQMASGIAHESRNALQQIGACAEMLAMELEHLPEALDLVSGVQEAEARLHRLLEDLRVFAVRLQVDRRQVDVAQAWRAAWEKLRGAHPQRNMYLVERLSAAEFPAQVSLHYLEQAFEKLFGNSVDASGQTVEVEVDCQNGDWEGRSALLIRVRDRGTGFTEEALKRCLEPFYCTKPQGTGLGLPIVKRIIEVHGGQLSVANAEPARSSKCGCPEAPDRQTEVAAKL